MTRTECAQRLKPTVEGLNTRKSDKRTYGSKGESKENEIHYRKKWLTKSKERGVLVAE